MTTISGEGKVDVHVGVTREVLDEVVESAKSDLRRDIKVYCALGVMGGNVVASVVLAKLSTTQPAQTVTMAARALLGL